MKKPVKLSTTDTTLPASDPLRFVKICFFLTKMTVDDQIKILDRNIKQNEHEHRMTQTETQLKYLHCLLKTWINMNI